MKRTLLIPLILVMQLLVPVDINALEFEGIQVHGFLSQGFLKSDKNNFLTSTEDGSLEFNEMGINFTTNLSDDLRVGLQLFSRDLGKDGNNQLTIDWAYGDYLFRDWFGIRVGKCRLIGGLFFEIRELDMLRTPILLPQSVYPDIWRDTFSTVKGTTFYGEIPVGVVGQLAYEAQIGAVNLNKDSGVGSVYEDEFKDYGLEITGMSADEFILGKIIWRTPIDGLSLRYTLWDLKDFSITGSVTQPFQTNMVYNLTTLDGYFVSLEYDAVMFVIHSEFSRINFSGEWKIDLPDSIPAVGFEERDALDQEGYYISLTFRFTDKLSIAIGYSDFYPDADNKDGEARHDTVKQYNQLLGIAGTLKVENPWEAWLKTKSISTRYDFTDNWLIKFEVDFNDGFGANTTAKNPDGLDRNWTLYATKITYSF